MKSNALFLEQRVEYFNFAIFFLLVTASVLPLLSFYFRGSIPNYWLAEGGLYESVGALAVFIGSAVAFVGFYVSENSYDKRRNWWLLLFSMALLILGGEEISWGQRLLGYEVSTEIMESNFQ